MQWHDSNDTCRLRHRLHKLTRAFFVTLLFAVSVTLHDGVAANCGGTERWSVKVASDPEAVEIDSQNIIDISVAKLNKIEPSDVIAEDDEFDRMNVEKKVYRVQGFIALYKLEPDGDYHIAVTDRTARVTKGGSHTTPTGHSFVAEIPHVKCFAGKHGDLPKTSRFSDEIREARAALENGVKDIDPHRIGPRSIPVTITGVLFFDFDHGQIGRGVVHEDPNGKHLVVELHPVLDIQFETRN